MTDSLGAKTKHIKLFLLAFVPMFLIVSLQHLGFKDAKIKDISKHISISSLFNLDNLKNNLLEILD